MIKKILYEAFKIILILSVGQIPFGQSTVGGEFVRHAKKGFSDLPNQVSKWKTREKTEQTFELIRKKLSQEDIREEESAAIQNLLEEEEE